MNADELVWIDRAVTRTVHRMWETSFGWHYEADQPRDYMDKEVMYRVDTVNSGTVLGAHPDLGDVWCGVDSIVKTKVTLPAEHGPWIKTSH